MARTYTIRQFAELAGVSVRALHHYDRIGLLSPERSGGGYRLYRGEDLETLEQIVALKFIGLSLKQIKAVLHRDCEAFARALAAQRIILGQKRKALDAATHAIEQVEQRLREGTEVDAGNLKQIIEVLDMHDDDAATKYQTLLDAKISRLREMSAERRAELGKEWAALFADVEQSLNENPASPKAQELATRWVRLLEVFNQGAAVDTALMQAGAYRVPSAEWPKGMQSFRNPGVWEFMGKALAVRGGSSR